MLKPIRSNVLVQCYPGNEVSEHGIIVPESHRGESNRVKIIAVGSGTKKKPMHLKPGQDGFRVKDWGEPVEENGELYYLMDSSAIIAVQ